MLSCILCLSDSKSSYYNICDICNNFKICNSCYNSSNTHQLKNCPLCRQSLSYYRLGNCYYNFINLKHYSFIFYYILFNIIIPNISICLYFPDPNIINKSFITHKTPCLLLLNYANIVLVPMIMYYYKDSTTIFMCYTITNIAFLILFSSTQHEDQREVIYYTYTVSYIYLCCLFHFFVLYLYYLILTIINYRNHILRNNPIIRLKYIEILYN